MVGRLRPLALLAAAAVAAGCGSSAGDGAPPAAPEARSNASAPRGAGPLRVGATGAGIGQALTGSPAGVELLPDTPVPGVPNTQQGVGAGASCEDADLMPAGDNLGAIRRATLCLLNGERADAGLRPLKEDGRLQKAAVRHAKAMVAKQFFDHVGRDGSDPVDRIRAAGYIPNTGSWTVGENLAWGTGSLATPKAIVAAWMKSEGHRDNILRGGYKEIGLGIVSGNPRSRDGSGATYATNFGAVTRPSRRATRARASRRGARFRSARTVKARIAVPSAG
jgi:uncharacterized protein YkwD